jgi:hypothetical protein
LLEKYYEVTCNEPGHFIHDLPKGDNDDEWFDNHALMYNSESCYLSHYLITFYRISRDGLDETDKIKSKRSYEYSKEKKMRKLKDEFIDSPFYKKTLLKHKIF